MVPWKRFRSGGLAALALLSLTACSGGFFPNFGQILPSDTVTQAFESHRVNPDYVYFYSGCDAHPNAVIGLHRDHRIDPEGLWKPVAMTPERMREMVQSMRSKAGDTFQYMIGFDLFDPQNRPLGVWYSLPAARTCLEILPGGFVRLDTPDLDTYNLMNQDSGWHPPDG